jgi:hypothetical protein
MPTAVPRVTVEAYPERPQEVPIDPAVRTAVAVALDRWLALVAQAAVRALVRSMVLLAEVVEAEDIRLPRSFRPLRN